MCGLAATDIFKIKVEISGLKLEDWHNQAKINFCVYGLVVHFLSEIKTLPTPGSDGQSMFETVANQTARNSLA